MLERAKKWQNIFAALKRNFISKERNNIVAKNGIILTQMNAIIE